MKFVVSLIKYSFFCQNYSKFTTTTIEYFLTIIKHGKKYFIKWVRPCEI